MRVLTYWRALMLTGLCAFWLGLVLATLQFPTAFDWRYMTVSNLFSAKHNPAGYRWGAAGIACCGVAGLSALLWDARSSDRLGGRNPLDNALLALGFGCMVLAAAVPPRWLIGKSHDWLAVIAFLSLCAALIRQAISALLFRYPAPASQRALRTMGFAVAALWPVVGAALSQAYLAICRPELPWVTVAWRDRGIPLILSFALWEWLTCVTLSVCLLLVALMPMGRGSLSPSN
jgi:hypothetical protein